MATVCSQSVLLELKNSPLVDIFKNKLKTFLFNRTLWLISSYVCLFVCYFVFQVNFYCPFFILDV